MHRFRTKLLTSSNNFNKKKKNKKAPKKPLVARQKSDPRNFRRSLSLKMGTDKIDDNMIRMEVINKFKQNFKMARISKKIGKKVSFIF
jgi:hypothetical protein